MGEGEDNSLNLNAKPPVALMVCGLQVLVRQHPVVNWHVS